MKAARIASACAIAVLATVITATAAAPSSATSRAAVNSVAAPTSPVVIVDVVPAGLSALVSWAPSNDTSVTGYTVHTVVASGFSPTPAIATRCLQTRNTTVDVSNSALLVTDLCTAVPYRFSVLATNAGGDGPAGALSNPIVPLRAQPPTAPLINATFPRAGGALVRWAMPALPGGAPLVNYIVSAKPLSKPKGKKKPTAVSKSIPPLVASTTISGLVNGVKYSVSVLARSSAGTSPASTTTVTPAAKVPATAPVGLQVTPDGRGNLVAKWGAPADAGSAVMTGYLLSVQMKTQSADGVWKNSGKPQLIKAPKSSTRMTISKLRNPGPKENPTYYEIQVRAVSKAGNSAPVVTANPVTPTVALAPGTVVLDAATLDALSSASDAALVWPRPGPRAIASVKAGSTLIGGVSANTPTGVLVKVTSVVDDGKSLTVTTGPAAITDAFQTMSLSFRGDSFAQPSAVARAVAPGIRAIAAAPRAGISASQERTISVSVVHKPFTVTGELTVKAEASIDINAGFRDYWTPHFHPWASVDAAASVTAKSRLKCVIELESKTKLFTISYGTPITVMVGPAPVVLLPQVPVYVTSSGKVEATVTATARIGGKMSWDSDAAGRLNFTNLSEPPNLDAEPPTASFEGRVGIEADPCILIYGITGPGLEAHLDLVFKVDLITAPNPGVQLSLGPEIIIKPTFKLDLKLFGDFNANLGLTRTFTFEPLRRFFPFGASLTVSPSGATATPGEPLQMSASGTNLAAPITWSLENGAAGDAITSGGVLTAVRPTGRTLTVVATDANGIRGRVDVAVGGELTTALNPSALGMNGTVWVSWTNPAGPGEPAVDHYVVTVSGRAPIIVDGVSVSIPGLQTGDPYDVTVWAVNADGISGPASVTPVRWSTGSDSVISDGEEHSCIIVAGGRVACWGNNTYAQLGQHQGEPDREPQKPLWSDSPMLVRDVTGTPITNATSVSSGKFVSCAVLSDGRVVCWGSKGLLTSYNLDWVVQELGAARPVIGVLNAVSVSVRLGIGAYACAVLTDHRIACWPFYLNSKPVLQADPVEIGAPVYVTDAVAVETGIDNVCFVRVDGRVACSLEGRQRSADFFAGTGFGGTVEGITGATAISSGWVTWCALLANGRVACWGENGAGQLGNGTRIASATPVLVTGITNAIAISVGFSHACALLASRRVVCWGGNWNGQLGDGTYFDSSTPVMVTGLTNVTAISAGMNRTCAMLADGSVVWWGLEWSHEKFGDHQGPDGRIIEAVTPQLAIGPGVV